MERRRGGKKEKDAGGRGTNRKCSLNIRNIFFIVANYLNKSGLLQYVVGYHQALNNVGMLNQPTIPINPLIRRWSSRAKEGYYI
jgi:hypothetical protein